MAFIETIQYQVVKKDGHIEIRDYGDILLASTKTPQISNQNSGFRPVFNYISGENESHKKISMTTPVVTYEEDESLVTGFYVPSKYDKETVPKPSSNHVFINEIKSSLFAVIKFRGSWRKENYDKHDKILLAYIHEHHYDIISPRYIFRYQPPSMPSFLRRNEIAYQVKR